MKKEKIRVRLNVDRNTWAEVKAEATREGKKAEDVGAELIALGLSVKMKGAER